MDSTLKSVVRECSHCKSPFRLYRSHGNRTYCSLACRRAAKPKVEKTCENCGTVYSKFQSAADRSRYCSKSCRCAGDSKRHSLPPITNRPCAICGALFDTRRHHGGNKTCSQKCASVLKTHSSTRPDSKIDKVCAVCGNPFRVFPSRSAIHCSRKCTGVANGERNRGTRKTALTVSCGFCGKSVTKPKCRIEAYAQAFCNSECYHSWDKAYKNTEEQKAITRARAVEMVASGVFTSPSRAEDTVAGWLTLNGLAFEQQIPLFHTFVADFKVGNTLVEVNGCYWHGCPCLNDELTEQQIKRQRRDRAVATYCRNRDIPLLVIWEHDVRAGNFAPLKSLLN